jgi:peptide deformylase
MSAEAEPVSIVQTGEQVLRQRAGEVAPSSLGTPALRTLVATMVATMRAAPGVGLAAPQIGVPLRVIVLEDPADLQASLNPAELRERGREPLPLRVLVNPVLRPIGDERATFFEGCLSVDGFAALVERSLEVEVSGLDENGVPVTLRARGWPARILQHELDHLDGTLYIDRMLSRSFATVEKARTLFAGKPIAEIRRLLGI